MKRQTARLARLLKDPQLGRLVLPLVLLSALTSLGTLGYVIIEGWSLGDAAYMVAITITTAGYKEVHDLSGPGRVLTSLLLFGGVGILFYSFSAIMSWVVETEMSGQFMRQQIRRRVRRAHDHVIVCGYGRVGQTVAAELARDGIPLVVIENDEQRFEGCLEDHLMAILGDATEDAVLIEAGIRQAQGLVLALDDDAKNVFITLTGRALNPNITVVARVSRAESAEKLLRAGANRVVSPYTMSGERMAALITRPSIVEFVDSSLRRDDVAINLEEVVIPSDSPLAGRTIDEIYHGLTHEITVLAVFGLGGLTSHPAPDHLLQAGDRLVVIGKHELIAELTVPIRAYGTRGPD